MMPIGVPRVPYRTPQSGGWQWVDIWNCLVCLMFHPLNPACGSIPSMKATKPIKRISIC